jgi:ubiquinone/menaquinone biosynthesis C-methylase UbiE
MVKKFINLNREFFINLQIEKIIQLLKKNKIDYKNYSCLDIGCQDGYTTSKLKKYFRHSIGIDIKKGFSNEGNYINGDVFKIPLKENSVDLIISFSLLHHFKNPDRVKIIKMSQKILKKNGILIILEYNEKNPIVRQYFNEQNENNYFVNKKGLTKELYSKGFEILDIEYLLYITDATKKLKFLETLLSKIPMGGKYIVMGKKI